jgi:hypothetical protein
MSVVVLIDRLQLAHSKRDLAASSHPATRNSGCQELSVVTTDSSGGVKPVNLSLNVIKPQRSQPRVTVRQVTEAREGTQGAEQPIRSGRFVTRTRGATRRVTTAMRSVLALSREHITPTVEEAKSRPRSVQGSGPAPGPSPGAKVW